MTEMPFDFTRYEIATNNAPCFAINDNDVQHFMARVCCHISKCYLSLQCLVSTYQQLLAGLARRIKSSFYLCASEGTVIQQAAIFPCKRNALRNTLINDIRAYFGQAMYIRFPRAIVATFYRIIK